MQIITDASVRRDLKVLAARQERTVQEVANDALRKYLSDNSESATGSQ